jgi:hypothetical protein
VPPPLNAAIPIRAGLLAILEVLSAPLHSASASPSNQLISTAFSASRSVPPQLSTAAKAALPRPATLHHTASHLAVRNAQSKLVLAWFRKE